MKKLKISQLAPGFRYLQTLALNDIRFQRHGQRYLASTVYLFHEPPFPWTIPVQPCMSDFYYWLIERLVHGWKNGRMGGFMDRWFCERKGLQIDK